ncbi:MAG: glycosyltransferase family 2 protein [Caldilineaceae bacterium]
MVIGAAFVDAVVVVDDGSADNTQRIAENAGARVLPMPQNGGKGAALQHGLKFVLEQFGHCAIVLLDGDGQHDPNEIPAIVEPILQNDADLVVGSRFLEVRSQIPWWRQIGQHGLTLVTNVASGAPLTDSQSGFRALSSRAAQKFSFSGKGFSVESEMQFAAREQGLRVREVSITCVYEEPPKRNPIKHGLQVLDGILRMVLQMRPLFFFGILSIAMLLTGLLFGLKVVTNFNAYRELAVGYALITVMLIVMGSIFLSTGVTLHALRSFLAHRLDK